VKVRSITVVGLLIFTTTAIWGCDAFGTPKPSRAPVGAAASPSRVPLPQTGGSEPPVASPTATPVEPSAAPESSASPDDDLEPDGSQEPDSSSLPGDPFGKAEATYRTGSATLTIGKQVIALERLAGTGTYFAEFGADVIWTGDAGWYVQLGGAKPSKGPIGIPAYIALDWVHDGQHWTSWDEDGCRVTILEADPGGVRGIASCSNMRWVDAIAGALADEPTPILGQAPFSAAVTFVARP
jgi:hypothetical protein